MYRSSMYFFYLIFELIMNVQSPFDMFVFQHYMNEHLVLLIFIILSKSFVIFYEYFYATTKNIIFSYNEFAKSGQKSSTQHGWP